MITHECSQTILATELHPLLFHSQRVIKSPCSCKGEKYKIKRIVYSTYQAVSGSGVKGVKDLENGINGESNEFYPKPIAYNCLPHIDVFTENGYTKEEMKMVNETMKLNFSF